MPVTDTPTFGWNISAMQILVLVGLVALVFAVIYTGRLAIGYLGMTLALSAFFLVVAFDIGLPRGGNDRGEGGA